ncbi:hypothetical protein LX36DRAFT_660650 [Colletotrichum falcatum]|nr:hypothetical protein LX36DRAFT_660650 [Colletotrichum falcatum]
MKAYLLDREDDWKNWFHQLSSKARELGLWESINPLTSSDERIPTNQLLLPPSRPALSDWAISSPKHFLEWMREHTVEGRPAPDITEARATKIVHLNEEDERQFRFLLQTYEMDYRQWEQQKRAVCEMGDWIRKTVHADIITECCDPDSSMHEWIESLDRYFEA